MKFVALSDTHCRHKEIRLPKGDVLLHAGDFTYKGHKAEALDFLKWFADQPFKHKIFIAGNHEFYFEKASAEEIKHLLPAGVVYLNDNGININGINIWGSPVTPWFHDWAFNRKRGAAINKHWKLIPPETDVLLTHGPPYGILDSVINDNQIGCRHLLQRVKIIKPKVHVFGHIHESYGSVVEGGTKFINASIVNESFERANKPTLFELR